MRTKFILLFALCLTFIGTAFAQSQPDPVNSILGDSSFLWKHGRFPGPNDTDYDRVMAHLEYAEYRIRQATPDDCPPEIAARRFELLDHLRDYRMAGAFPLNYERADRRPCFIDSVGRICAVGYLVEQTAGRELAEKINEEYKYAYVMEMQAPEIESWMNTTGLKVEEFAMIQPYYGPAISNPYFIGNEEKSLEKWFREEVEFPFSATNRVELDISFLLSKFGNPQWPINIHGGQSLAKKDLKKIRKAILKLRFTPYKYEHEAQDFSYSMKLIIAPKGRRAADPMSSEIEGSNFNLSAANTNQEEVYIQGTIRDMNTQEPIPFATVMVQSTQIGARTNLEGWYKLKVPYDQVKTDHMAIEVKNIGFKTVLVTDVPYNNQTINLSLKEEIIILNDYSFHPPEVYWYGPQK